MLMNTIFKNLKTLVNSSVIKMNNMAKEYETLESVENSDTYIAAYQKTDTFDMYLEFDLDVIISTKITNDPDLQIQYANNPSSIPSQYRNIVLEAQRKYIIDNYIEINNYYRMLNGLPNIEEPEEEFIKLTTDQMIKAEVSDNNYIHLLSNDDIYRLDENGILDDIISKNPTKKYLNYLGYNKISIVEARTANSFSILKVNLQDVPDEFYNTFSQIYNQNREYFMSVIYNSEYSTSYDLYDNFMGLCIMIMTIQRVLSNTFKFGIQREFYDWTFIQNMYKMYNVPFVKSLPLDYQVILLKNLNNLLRYKSTDKVLFDIASLLGYERLKIFKYYLVKKHKIGDNEEPLFYYKQKKNENGEYVYDENGDPIYEEDIERMYDLYFQRVNLKERNIGLALQEESNKLSYEEVTINDPYWWEDSNLTEAMYNNEYNFVETKYLSLNLMYKMTEMLFEVSYAFRMLIDKEEELKPYRILLPKVYGDSDFKIFDVVVFLVALMCKAQGFKDGTVTTPSMISHIYSFNFDEESVEKIKSIITDHADLVDQKTLDYFSNLTIKSADDVNNLYIKIREYNDYILDKMRRSQNIKEYHLYKDIFTISMISETQTKMFNITVINEDGTTTERPAKTYLEYLKYKEPILGQFVENISGEDIGPIIEHVTSEINGFMSSLKYTFLFNDNNNPVFTALAALIKFFKSYTVDISSFSVLYIFDSKYYNLFKMTEDIHQMNVNLGLDGTANQLYADDICSYSSFFKYLEKYKNEDWYNLVAKLTEQDKSIFRDFIKSVLSVFHREDTVYSYEKDYLSGEITIKNVLKLLEVYGIDKTLLGTEKLSFEHKIKEIMKQYCCKDMKELNDYISHLIVYRQERNRLRMRDRVILMREE